MKTLRVSGVIVMIIIMIIVIIYAFQLKRSLTILIQIDEDMKMAVGDTVVLQNDTLIIVDYSILNDNFILSNGIKVSSEFVTKQIAK